MSAESADGPDEAPFGISLASPYYELGLACETSEERDTWIRVLNSHIQLTRQPADSAPDSETTPS